MNKKLKTILIREGSTFLIIIAISYVLDILFLITHIGSRWPSIPFWEDPYAYQFWKNSIRENAQMIRYLGYPAYLLVRFLTLPLRRFQSKKTVAIHSRENKVRQVLEDITKEIKLKRKIADVEYRGEHLWYIIRFRHPPSCIMPRALIDSYVQDQSKDTKEKIIHLLLGRE